MKLSRFRFQMAVALIAMTGVSNALAIDVLIEEDSRVPIAYVNVVIRSGAIADPEGATGLTTFLGSMMLRGTQRHTKEQIDLMLDQWGAQLGIETRTESTVVRGAVLSTKLPDFLELIGEILSLPVFPESEIRKLKAETLSNLLAMQGNDHALAARKFGQFLFQDHPYGRPLDGISSEVSRISREQLVHQHRNVFRRDVAQILAVGDVDSRVVRSWALRLESLLPKGDGPIARAVAPSLPTKRRLQIVDKPDRTQTQILIGQRGVTMKDPDYYALYLGNVAFGGGSFMSRLMQEIRVKRGWSYGARSAFRFSLQPRSWQVHLFPAENETPAALQYTIEMIESLRSKGITEKEFQLARQSSINSAAFLNDTPKKRIENRILESTLELPKGFFADFAKNLAKVTREEVNQALARFLNPESLTITVVGTASRLKQDLAVSSRVSAQHLVVTPYTAD